jgi:hypothetical protein
MAAAGEQSVKVTNIGYAQPLSAPIIVAHHKDVSLFELGQPASAEVAAFSQGDSAALEEYITSAAVSPYICGWAKGDATLMPGDSLYIAFNVSETTECNCEDMAATVLAHMEATNDGFAAVNTVLFSVAPENTLDEHHAPWDVYFVNAYDAGSEANTEVCADLTFCPNEVSSKAKASSQVDLEGEGFIHVHRGISGNGDLDRDVHDWKNPVAMVELHSRMPAGIAHEEGGHRHRRTRRNFRRQ